jgi:hypothetical protein
MQQTPGQAIGQNIQQGQAPGQVPQVPTPPPVQPGAQQATGQVTAQPIQATTQAPQINPQQILSQFQPGVEAQINTLAQNGNDATQIDAFFEKFAKGTKGKIEKASNMPFAQFVDEYIKNKPHQQEQPEAQQQEPENVPRGTEEQISTSQLPESTKTVEKPIEVGSEVITPSGDIAKIDLLPGKTAKVDVDGKKQVFETDDLVPIPENHQEIGDLYQQLIDKIPEGQKSRVYDAIGYDPNRNAIKYTYHDGKSYIIDDVPEEIVKEIVNSGFLAKTSGGNYMGFYYKGNPSIGAGMHVLISDLQRLRGGKGKEYSYKFEELYSQHRLPKNILKERHEKEQAKKKAKKK